MNYFFHLGSWYITANRQSVYKNRRICERRCHKSGGDASINEIFVKNDIFGGEELPHQNIRRFYPRSNVIRSTMCCTMKSLRKSMIDQECLMVKIEQWKTEDSSALLFSSKMCEKKNYLPTKSKSISKIVTMKMTKSNLTER